MTKSTSTKPKGKIKNKGARGKKITVNGKR